MKILIVQDFLRSGGTERQSILLANAFSRAGHTTSLVTFRPGGALQSTLSPAVARSALQRFDLRWDWFAPGLVARVLDVAPDVTLCMGRMANCYAGRIQRKAAATAVVATMRTGKSLPPLFRASLPHVRHVIANSREARDTLVNQHHVPGSRITVIYNSLVFPADTGLGVAERQSVRLRWRESLGATDRTTVFLCVAMFRREKNQRELIEIVDGLPRNLDWQLWLAGEGRERQSCEAFVRAKNLSARVKFPGFHVNPSELYRAADVAVHASWSEALSNFLIEAQAHGLTAVAYNAQGIQECFIPQHTGWAIEPNDRKAFRAALEDRINEPPATRRSAAASARAFARETFDPNRQVLAHLDVFAQLAPPSPVRAG